MTMTRWLPPEVLSGNLPSLADSLHMIFSGTPPAGQTWDVISGATHSTRCVPSCRRTA